VERKNEFNETALRAERLANLLTLSYEPMLAWRLDGPIEFWNAGAEQLYGITRDEAVGRSSHALLQTKFPIDFAELRSRTFATSQRNTSGGTPSRICPTDSK
jgi:PAS domain S-box-containing protein